MMYYLGFYKINNFFSVVWHAIGICLCKDTELTALLDYELKREKAEKCIKLFPKLADAKKMLPAMEEEHTRLQQSFQDENCLVQMPLMQLKGAC